jgi:hypothetical protein
MTGLYAMYWILCQLFSLSLTHSLSLFLSHPIWSSLRVWGLLSSPHFFIFTTATTQEKLQVWNELVFKVKGHQSNEPKTETLKH